VDVSSGETGKKKCASAGPTGRMRRPFVAASELPQSGTGEEQPSSINTPTARRERNRDELRSFFFQLVLCFS